MSAEMDFPSNGNDSPDLADKSAWVSVQRGPYRWDLQSLVRHWVTDDGELPLSQWQKEQRVSIIKTGPHRTVYHVKLPDGNFFLKHYRTADWQAILQNIVRPCKADLEWQAAKRIAALGLPTIETVAIGRKKQFGLIRDNFLVSREIEGVEPLDQFVLRDFPQMDARLQQHLRRDIARQLGRMTAILHRNGVLHRDLHPGNVLLQRQGEQGNLFLIDLHSTSWKRRLSLKQIAVNLSLLNNFFSRLTWKTDRLRFLNSYRQIWNAGQALERQLAADAIKRIGEICQQELEQADLRGDKKWQRGNRRLLILNGPPNHCRGLASLGKEQLHRLREHPEALFEKSRLIAWQKREATFQRGLTEISVKGKSQTAIVMAFREAHRARQGWEMGHALVRRRLPAPRPLLFVETPTKSWDYLVIESIPQAVSLKLWLMKLGHTSCEREKRRQLQKVIRAVAVQLRRLHDHGFDQPQLGLRAFLIQETESAPKIWFASLETLDQPHRVDSSRLQYALAMLFGSVRSAFPLGSTDYLRFLRAYLQADFRREWKSYWRGIAGLVVKTTRREAA